MCGPILSLLLSFIWLQKKKDQPSLVVNGHDGSGDQKDTKKKKKKDKPSAMSLEQFNKQIDEKKSHVDGKKKIQMIFIYIPYRTIFTT